MTATIRPFDIKNDSLRSDERLRITNSGVFAEKAEVRAKAGFLSRIWTRKEYSHSRALALTQKIAFEAIKNKDFITCFHAKNTYSNLIVRVRKRNDNYIKLSWVAKLFSASSITLAPHKEALVKISTLINNRILEQKRVYECAVNKVKTLDIELEKIDDGLRISKGNPLVYSKFTKFLINFMNETVEAFKALHEIIIIEQNYNYTKIASVQGVKSEIELFEQKKNELESIDSALEGFGLEMDFLQKSYFDNNNRFKENVLRDKCKHEKYLALKSLIEKFLPKSMGFIDYFKKLLKDLEIYQGFIEKERQKFQK